MPITVTYTVAYAIASDLKSGQLTITDTTDYAGQGITASNVEFAWGFSHVNSGTYRSVVLGQPQNILHSPGLSATVPLPTDMNGDVITGDYEFSWRIYSAIGPIDETGGPDIENLCTDFPAWQFDEDVNCFAAWVTVTDNTEWLVNGWTVNSRLLTLQYPLSTVQHADITSTTSVVSTAGEAIFRGQWKVFGEWNVTKGNLTVDIEGYKTFDVGCNTDSCKRWCQIECAFEAWQAVKDNPNLSGAAQAKWELMLKLSMMLDKAEQCGDRTLISTLSAAYAKAAKDCGCGCGNQDSDLISPIYGTSGSAPLIVAGSGIVVVYGSGTVTISLTTQELAILAGTYNTTVSSPLGTITVTGPVITAGTPPVHDYEIEVTDLPTDSMEFVWTVTPSGTFALSTPNIIGTEFQSPTITATGGGFYAVTGFFVGTAFPVNVQVSILEVTRRAPYDVTHRNNILVDVQVYTEANTFTIGLIPEDALFTTNRGQAKEVVFFARYISTMEILFKITKK